MFSEFFIKRPKFALVVSLVITLIGAIAIFTLPISMFPSITPPEISVTAQYPGADAQTIEQTVIQPLENAINGVDNMLYISSNASNSGSASIAVTFKTGTDPNQALIHVQNRISSVQASLPDIVKQQGISVDKRSSSMLMGITLSSTDPKATNLYLGGYASNYIFDELTRVPGVAQVQVMGQSEYSMRIWLNPDKMHGLNITVSDVVNAIREQNVAVSAGGIGQAPNPAHQKFQYTIKVKGRLSDAKEFGNIIIKSQTDGSNIYLKDVAQIKLGAKDYSTTAKLDGKPTAFIVVYQQAGANALDVAAGVNKTLKRLEKNFPEGMKYSLAFDSPKFISQSIHEVVITLIIAILLVILVVLFFLQNIRAVLIPTIAIPVSLIGTFAIMNWLGYSINTITLFALVLAIGIVVDDAIIVIENVDRLITKEHLPPKEATILAMKQVTGPIIATTLVLLAVFIPVAFMPGITGKIYSQFAVTLSVAVFISSINALTLSPALCATLLKPGKIGHAKWLKPIDTLIQRVTGKYNSILKTLLRKSAICLVIFAIILLGTGWMAKTTPQGFLPQEDQGFFLVNVALPDGASLSRTEETMNKIDKMLSTQPGVAHVVTIAGFSFFTGQSSNAGIAIIMLKDWSQRKSIMLQSAIIIRKTQGLLFTKLPSAQAIAFEMPSIPGLGTSSGFDFQLQDVGGHTPQEFSKVLNDLLKKANQAPSLTRVFSPWQANAPQYQLDIDRQKAKTLGVSLQEVFLTLQAQLGSLYVNDFTKFAKSYQVKLMAQSQFRNNAEALNYYYVRNKQGDLVPLTAFASLKPALGPNTISHYNLYRSVAIQGQAAPGYSSGQAIQTMEVLAKSLPKGYSYSWSGQSLQQIKSGNLAPLLFLLSLIFVYLFLVAKYESWSIPLSIIAAVPIATCGALIGIKLMSMLDPRINNDIYAQIGMILLIGMVAKTAILIVEFAVNQRKSGYSIIESASNAASLRFRAVLMTALSLIFGVLPLILSSGAGSISRRIIGITVASGMLLTTILGVIFVPLLYVTIQKIREHFYRKKESNKTSE